MSIFGIELKLIFYAIIITKSKTNNNFVRVKGKVSMEVVLLVIKLVSS